MRKPSILYCKYDENHSFQTFEEREAHEAKCPKKASFEEKYTKSQQVYNKFKDKLKTTQRQRKDQHQELFGHNNGPMAAEMPTLHYKYRMNEPFVNGEAA